MNQTSRMKNLTKYYMYWWWMLLNWSVFSNQSVHVICVHQSTCQCFAFFFKFQLDCTRWKNIQYVQSIPNNIKLFRNWLRYLISRLHLISKFQRKPHTKKKSLYSILCRTGKLMKIKYISDINYCYQVDATLWGNFISPK